MAVSKSGAQETIPARFPPHLVARMDEMIREGRYTSRSLLVRAAVEKLLDEEKVHSQSRHFIREDLEKGLFDDLLERRMRQILSRLVVTPEQ